jgi:Ricin-type beta-trefoil lectin domain-like
MRTRLMRTSLLTPVLLALLFVAAGSAFGEMPQPDVLYRITAKHSGKCLEVQGGPTALRDGARVVQGDCNNADNQKWTFTRLSDGNYSIIAKHSGKGLDVFGGIFSTGNGVIVEQWAYNSGPNQMWIVSDLGNSYYKILARHSGKSLDIDTGRGAQANGAQAQQWDYWGGDNQKFKLTALTDRSACSVTDPLTSTFAGTGNLRTTHPRAPGPFPSGINLTVKFTGCRANISITNFPPLTNSSENPPNTATLTMSGGGSGSFASSNGRIIIPITLSLENSNTLFGNSTLPLVLAAEGVADMKNADTGIVTLRGTGTFMGGALGGFQGTLTVTGSFSPRPR